MVWTQEQMIIMQGENVWDLTVFPQEQLHIQIQGDTTIEGAMTLHQNKPIFLEILGTLALHLPNQPNDFSSLQPQLFIHVTEQLSLHPLSSGDKTLQVNGYVWIENACPLLAPLLQAVYWKGSLACPGNPSSPSTVPLHLLHHPPADSPPGVFARTTMQFNGIRLLDQ